MMSWLKRFASINKVAGVSIQIKGGAISYSFCVLEKQRSKVIMTQCTENASIEQIRQLNLPISLVIDGTGILTKAQYWISEAGISIEDVLPGADPTQFCISSYQTAGRAYASIARTSLVEELIQPFRGNHLLAVALGPIGTMSIFDLLGKEESFLSPANAIIKASGSWKITEIGERLSDTYDCSGIIVQDIYLPCFCAALSYLLSPDQSVSAIDVRYSQQRYYQEALLRQGMIGFGAVLFVGLLINFIAFSMLSSRHERLQEQAIALGASYQKTDSLARELESKKNFLRQSGWMSSSEQSYYADQLATTRPEGLVWTQLNIHPRYKTDAETYAFQVKSIRIKGAVKNVFDLNAWQKKLALLSWIDKTELEYLKKNDETQYSDFSLFIATK